MGIECLAWQSDQSQYTSESHYDIHDVLQFSLVCIMNNPNMSGELARKLDRLRSNQDLSLAKWPFS